MAKKIVIASGKGGVGKTTVCIGLGKALCKSGFRVLIVDFDNLRSVDLLADAAERIVYDWGDVVLGRCESSEAIYDCGEISIMSCPGSYGDFKPSDIKKLMMLYDSQFDYILMDSPAGIGTGLSLACSGADRGLVVSIPDLVSVRSACIAADSMKQFGVDNCRLIINRFIEKDIRKKRLLNIDEVIDSTEVQLIGIVPEDKKIRMGSMGRPIFMPDQISYYAFTRIAQRIQGKNVPLEIL